MELVRGKTLTDLIESKGLGLKRFFEIAVPVADAVSSAHGHGITHRDLKADNIMVNDEGQLKILDFGLAKLRPEAGGPSDSALPTVAMTEAGRIVGRAAYMSPEQAEGKKLDHRTDVFSLGIIFYEMLAGERPFKGDGPGSFLSAILRDTPASVTTLNPTCPPELARIVKRSLVKDPDRRYQSAKDLRNELDELKQELDSGELLETAQAAAPAGRNWALWAGLGAVVAAAALAGYFLRPDDSASTGREGQSVTGRFSQLTSNPAREWFPTLSPDGKWVVYASDTSGNQDLYLQSVSGERAINLTEGVDADDTQPAFSPDGEQIVFRSERDGGGLFVMGRTGESVRRVADFGFNPAWSPDGKRIVCATAAIWNRRMRPPSELWIIDTGSGEKRLLTDVDATQPHWSPNGDRIAFWSVLEGAELWTMSVDGGDRVRVTEDGHFDWNPVWSPDGKYLYFSGDRRGAMNLWRVAISEETGEALGTPEPVTSGVAVDALHLSFSGDGRKVAYVAQTVTSNIQRVDFDPAAGEVRREPIAVTEGSNRIADPAPSPDGEWLAYWTESEQEDLFVMRSDGSGRRQLTDDLAKDRYPRWSPDGKRIAFMSGRSGSYQIWLIRPDGSGLRQLTDTADSASVPVWSPDGSRMVYLGEPEEHPYLFEVETSWSDQEPQRLPTLDDGDDTFVAFDWSPDGRLAASLHSAGQFGGGVIVYDFQSQRYEKLSDVGWAPRWVASTDWMIASIDQTLVLIDSSTKEQKEVLSLRPHLMGGAAGFAPTSDGQTIYFAVRTTEADIWLLTLDDET